jgi:hypothetical protein
MKKKAPRRLLTLLVSALFILGLPYMVSANSPEAMRIFYDFKTQTLSVTITHPSKNPGTHFVKEVTVKKNGQLIQRGVYTKQEGDVFTYTYALAATADDTIEVTAVCSVSGSLTKKYRPGV